MSKNIAIRGVYEMCFSNQRITYPLYQQNKIKSIYYFSDKDASYVLFHIGFKNRGAEQSKREHDKTLPAVEVSDMYVDQ